MLLYVLGAFAQKNTVLIAIEMNFTASLVLFMTASFLILTTAIGFAAVTTKNDCLSFFVILNLKS